METKGQRLDRNKSESKTPLTVFITVTPELHDHICIQKLIRTRLEDLTLPNSTYFKARVIKV